MNPEAREPWHAQADVLATDLRRELPAVALAVDLWPVVRRPRWWRRRRPERPRRSADRCLDEASIIGHAGSVSDTSPKSGWVGDLPVGDSGKRVLGRLVDVDHDEFETSLYEAAADPQAVQIERDQRRYRERFRRRLRILRAKHRDEG